MKAMLALLNKYIYRILVDQERYTLMRKYILQLPQCYVTAADGSRVRQEVAGSK